MTDQHSLDAIAILGVIATFLGLWAIWPPVAVVAAGATLVIIAVGLTMVRIRREKPGDDG